MSNAKQNYSWRQGLNKTTLWNIILKFTSYAVAVWNWQQTLHLLLDTLVGRFVQAHLPGWKTCAGRKWSHECTLDYSNSQNIIHTFLQILCGNRKIWGIVPKSVKWQLFVNMFWKVWTISYLIMRHPIHANKIVPIHANKIVNVKPPMLITNNLDFLEEFIDSFHELHCPS